MISDKEVRLFGQPIKIIIPGKDGDTYSGRRSFESWSNPLLKAGVTYSGYAMYDIDEECADLNIYLDIDNKLYQLSDWSIPDIRPLNQHAYKVQQFVSFERIHAMLMLIYDKLKDRE